MDASNTGEWLRSVGTMNESFGIANKGSFGSGELAYDEAQSGIDCFAPSEVHKKFANEVRGSNCCAFGKIRSRDCTRIE